MEANSEHEARRDDPVDAVEVVRLLVRVLILAVHHVDEVEDREEGADIEELLFLFTYHGRKRKRANLPV